MKSLQNGVCIVRFERRHKKPGFSTYRRMCCTLSMNILGNPKWAKVFGYKQPKGFPRYVPKEKNLIIVFDLMKGDFRCINCNDVWIMKKIPDDL